MNSQSPALKEPYPHPFENLKMKMAKKTGSRYVDCQRSAGSWQRLREAPGVPG